MTIFLKLFPKQADYRYTGSMIAYWFFVALSIVSMGRSLVHLLIEDGGAGTIAGLDLSQGNANIIFAFGLWGLSQVIYAFIQLLVSFRYRSLIPLMILVLILEILGRMFVGWIKPPIMTHVIPGGVANWILLPLAVIMFVLSLQDRKSR